MQQISYQQNLVKKYSDHFGGKTSMSEKKLATKIFGKSIYC